MKTLRRIYLNDFLLVILIFGILLMAFESIGFNSLKLSAFSIVLIVLGNLFILLMLFINLIIFLIKGFKNKNNLNIKNNVIVFLAYILGIIYAYPKIMAVYNLVTKSLKLAGTDKVVGLRFYLRLRSLLEEILAIQPSIIMSILNIIFIILIIIIIKFSLKENLYKKM